MFKLAAVLKVPRISCSACSVSKSCPSRGFLIVSFSCRRNRGAWVVKRSDYKQWYKDMNSLQNALEVIQRYRAPTYSTGSCPTTLEMYARIQTAFPHIRMFYSPRCRKYLHFLVLGSPNYKTIQNSPYCRLLHLAVVQESLYGKLPTFANGFLCVPSFTVETVDTGLRCSSPCCYGRSLATDARNN